MKAIDSRVISISTLPESLQGAEGRAITSCSTRSSLNDTRHFLWYMTGANKIYARRVAAIQRLSRVDCYIADPACEWSP